MKIYTRTGDNGTTGLIGGNRVAKHDPRLDCYGTLDELNAHLGLAAVLADDTLLPQLLAVQEVLFTLGSHLAVPEGNEAAKAKLPPIDENAAAELELQIDTAEAELAPLANFILPGGAELAARLHVARTVCRRAERLVSAFAFDRPMHTPVVTYLNRLSDWLFVQARLANHRAGVADVPWVPKA